MDLRTKCQFSPQLGTHSCMNTKSSYISFIIFLSDTLDLTLNRADSFMMEQSVSEFSQDQETISL